MFRTMRLRDKMTFWYTAITVIALGTFAAVLYFMTANVLQQILEREARLSLQQLSAQVELEDGALTFENEVPLSSGSMYYIMEENGSELASYGKDISFFENVPIVPGQFRTVTSGSDEWLLLDSDPVAIQTGKNNREKGEGDIHASAASNATLAERDTVRVRVVISCALRQRVLSTLLMVFGGGIPLLALFALSGGSMIAKHSLRPIRQIISSVGIIAGGDLSERIPNAPVNDEIGELTDTLNQMLASVETAFTREKRFASDASHELRTPVAVIRAYTEAMLTEKDTTEDQRASLQTMLTECRRMQKIIEQLLTITRGQEGRYPLCIEPVSLKAVCGGVADTLADMLTEKTMELCLDVPDTLSLEADQSLLTEMILNRVENAVKYGKPRGQIRIEASAIDGQVNLRVSDDGIGIAKEALPSIFDRFYRVDAVRDRSGTGLGLSIVKWIVQVHCGSVRVESEPGQGTTFLISLPLAQSKS